MSALASVPMVHPQGYRVPPHGKDRPMSAAPEFVGFDAMRMFAGEVDNAIAALPPQPSEEDADSAIIIMDAYLQMGEWTIEQRERICTAARRQLLAEGRLA